MSTRVWQFQQNDFSKVIFSFSDPSQNFLKQITNLNFVASALRILRAFSKFLKLAITRSRKKGVFKNFAISTGNRLCWSLFNDWFLYYVTGRDYDDAFGVFRKETTIRQCNRKISTVFTLTSLLVLSEI